MSDEIKGSMFGPREPKLTDDVFLQVAGSGGSTIELRPPLTEGSLRTKHWRALIESGDPIGDGFYDAVVSIDAESMERLRVRLNALAAIRDQLTTDRAIESES